MANWFRTEEAVGGKAYYSIDDERIILMKRGTPARVVDKGRFKTSGWDIFNGEYDTLLIVDLRPKEFLLNISEGLTTLDGVRVSGKISTSARIKSDRDYLLRIALNSDEEEKFLIGILRQAIKTTIAASNWTDLLVLTDEQLEVYKKRVRENLVRSDICFSLLDILEILFTPIDKDLADKLEKKKKIQIEEEFQRLTLEAAKRTKEIELANEAFEKQKKRDIEKEEFKHQLDLDKLKQKQLQDFDEDKYNFEKKKTNDVFAREIEKFQMQADFLLKNPILIQLINPDLAKAIAIAEASANQKSTEVIRTILMKTLEEDAEKAKLIGHIEQRTTELRSIRKTDINFSGNPISIDDLMQPKKEPTQDNLDNEPVNE